MPKPNLKRYRAKRDFSRTNEPAGGAPGESRNLFMVHKHDATRLHYDLRLQIGEVLKSWAVPKGPSLDPGERRLAVEVEHHPLEYGAYEGVIPDGQYGAGPTLVWDRGTWAPMGDLDKSLKSGTLKFRLAGEKLKGGWTLTRLKRKAGETQDNWLLIKEHDDAASDINILETRPESVLSGLTVEELLEQERQRGKPAALRPGSLKGARKGALPRTVKPMLASPVTVPPDGGDWIHEIKFDGYRTLARIDAGDVRLFTRNGHDWTAKYGDLCDAFVVLPCKSAILDGEVVVLDSDGVSRFAALQEALADGQDARFVYFAFDLVFLNGWDLRNVALIRRKGLLAKFLDPVIGATSAIQFSAHMEGKGGEFYEHACALGVEGVVSKRGTSGYRSGRSKIWLKAKAMRQGTFAVVGYQTSRAAGGLASLLLADNVGGRFHYAGKVGSGISAAIADGLLQQLEPYARRAPAIEFSSKAPKANWVEPRLQARVRYAERTRDNHLRHPVFLGLEEAQPASQPVKRLITDRDLANIWVTNPDRRMFSRAGPTKLDLAVYYARIGDYLLAHCLNRPVSLVRCPTGQAKDCFFQRHAFSGMPGEIGTFVLTKEKGEKRDYLVMENARGYLALAQFGVVEFHPWGCRIDMPERPDRMVLDLDPGDGIEWRHVVEAALHVREVVSGFGLRPFVKTTGGKGIHVVVPLVRRYSWSRVHRASGEIADRLARENPQTYTASMAKNRRVGRIFVDFHRNARGSTAVGAYSARAVAGLPVSTPLAWDDLSSIDDPADLNYSSVPDLVTHSGDPWGDIEQNRGSLPEQLTSGSA